MTHIQMGHVAHTNQPCLWNKSCEFCEWVMLHVWMSQVYEQVMSMSHVAHMNDSRLSASRTHMHSRTRTYALTNHVFSLTNHTYSLTNHIYSLTNHIYSLTNHIYSLTNHKYSPTNHIYSVTIQKLGGWGAKRAYSDGGVFASDPVFMSHIQLSHASKWVMPLKWVMSRTWSSHGAHMNGSCLRWLHSLTNHIYSLTNHMYAFTNHIWMGHVSGGCMFASNPIQTPTHRRHCKSLCLTFLGLFSLYF